MDMNPNSSIQLADPDDQDNNPSTTPTSMNSSPRD